MNGRIALLALALTLPAVLHAGALAADPGRTVLASLEIGVDARAAAMGEAYAAMVRDASGTYWNPASLGDIERNDVVGMHNEWLLDLRQEFIAGAMRRGRHAFGASFTGMFTDNIDGRDATGRDVGTFGWSDISFSGSYAFRATPDLGLGGTVRYVRSSTDAVVTQPSGGFSGASMSGLTFDLGATFDTPLEGLRAAAVLRHLGGKMSYDIENAGEFDLPTTVDLGLGYVRHDLGGGTLSASADLVKASGDDASMRFGAEYAIKDFIALAAGLRTGMDNQDLSFGAGYIKKVRAYYAFVPTDSDLGSTHRFTLGYSW